MAQMDKKSNETKKSLLCDFKQEKTVSKNVVWSPKTVTSKKPNKLALADPDDFQDPVKFVFDRKPMPDTKRAIALSCFVFWCCGFSFGMIAFFFASKGLIIMLNVT